MPLFVALKRISLGGGKFLPAGSLVPQAATWRRLDVAADRGEVLVLSDEVIAAIRNTPLASESIPAQQDPSASASAAPNDPKRRAPVAAPGK